ncbi:MAG: hypothetical protein ABEK50_13480 [bacterium]
MKRSSFLLIAMLLSVGLSGCANPEDVIVSSAMEGMQRAAGERVQNATYRALAPEETAPEPNQTQNWNRYMIHHAQTIFAHSFTVGGYWITRAGYEPGEWTRFQIRTNDNENEIILERAFLKRTSDGNEWWRVTWTANDDKTWVYESLIDPNQGNLLRLRGKDSEGNVKEIPVQKGTVYQQPRELTEESIEGAIVGSSTIETPAGSFSGDHVQYGAMGAQGDVNFWLNDSVPGGVVKYQMSHSRQGAVWTSTLIDYGTGATTQLESY